MFKFGEEALLTYRTRLLSSRAKLCASAATLMGKPKLN